MRKIAVALLQEESPTDTNREAAFYTAFTGILNSFTSHIKANISKYRLYLLV